MKKLVNIGLIGFGTVGSGVTKLLINRKSEIKKRTGITLNLKKIADLDIKSRRNVKVPKQILTTDSSSLIHDPEIDIIIELIGGTKTAYKIVTDSLTNNKHVVTANKALLAEKGLPIFRLANKKSLNIGFEASVAGCIPVIKTIKESFTSNKIQKVFGILNGTCNYILTKMSKNGNSFVSALKEAQKLGFAELDPTLDINGTDAAHKINIIASLVTNTYVDFKNIYIEGISKLNILDIIYAEQLGYTLKLLAILKIDNNIDCRVHPVLISKAHLLSSVINEYNAVFIDGEATGETMFYGKGAGSMPTANAVVADCIDISKAVASNCKLTSLNLDLNNKVKVKNIKETTNRYYFRFSTIDKPGVLAKIAGILGKNLISISSVIQKEENKNVVPIVILTHKAKEEKVQKSIKEIDKLEFVKKKSVFYRIVE